MDDPVHVLPRSDPDPSPSEAPCGGLTLESALHSGGALLQVVYLHRTDNCRPASSGDMSSFHHYEGDMGHNSLFDALVMLAWLWLCMLGWWA
jgi:hypothetical protein